MEESMKLNLSNMPRSFDELIQVASRQLGNDKFDQHCLIYSQNGKDTLIDSEKKFEEFVEFIQKNNGVQPIIKQKANLIYEYNASHEKTSKNLFNDDNPSFINNENQQIDDMINEYITVIQDFKSQSKAYIDKRNMKLIDDLRESSFSQKGFNNEIEKFTFEAIKDLGCDTIPMKKYNAIPQNMNCSYCTEKLDVPFKLFTDKTNYYLCQYCHLLLSPYFDTNFVIQKHVEPEQVHERVENDYGFKAKLLNTNGELKLSINKQSQSEARVTIKMENNGIHDWTPNNVEFNFWIENAKSHEISLAQSIPRNSALIQEIKITNLLEKTKGVYNYKLRLYEKINKKNFGDEIHVTIDIN